MEGIDSERGCGTQRRPGRRYKPKIPKKATRKAKHDWNTIELLLSCRMSPAPRFLHSHLDSRLFDEPKRTQTFRNTFFDDRSPDPVTLPPETSFYIAQEEVTSAFSVRLTICFWPRVEPHLIAPERLYSPCPEVCRPERLNVQQSPRFFRATLSVYGTRSQDFSLSLQIRRLS